MASLWEEMFIAHWTCLDIWHFHTPGTIRVQCATLSYQKETVRLLLAPSKACRRCAWYSECSAVWCVTCAAWRVAAWPGPRLSRPSPATLSPVRHQLCPSSSTLQLSSPCLSTRRVSDASRCFTTLSEESHYCCFQTIRIHQKFWSQPCGWSNLFFFVYRFLKC